MLKASVLALSCALLLPGVAHAQEQTNTISVQPTSSNNVGKHKKSKANHSRIISRILRPQYFKTLYQTGEASFYGIGDGFNGARTASGRRFNTYTAMCAHMHLKFGTVIKIVNLKNGMSTTCAIWDRGPFNYRVLDMSYAVKMALGIRGGTAQVAIYR